VKRCTEWKRENTKARSTRCYLAVKKAGETTGTTLQYSR